jgi:phosphoribosylglycinamide formyltransferase-1
MTRMRVGVLLSGRGSNMQALLQACAEPDYPAAIVLVLSNNADAGGLAYAERQGVPALAIDHRPFGEDRQAHERRIDAALREAGVQIVCLAGYMRILTPWLIDAWEGRMINIHPSLLPLFPGLHTHARALEAGMKLHGCSVHQVTAEVDVGPILGQAAVPVLPGDDADSLAARVLRAEHRLYPACLAAFARGEPATALDTASLFNPAG